MLLRYWQAALIAAFMTLFGNVVWAQTTPQGGCTGCRHAIFRQGNCCEKQFSCATEDCCKEGNCCKDAKCCKEGESCCKSHKCDKQCTHYTETKCDCTKGGECCCKKGECECGKSCKCCGKEKASHTKTGRCPFLNKLAKKAAILMVMPSPRYLEHPPQYIPPSPPFPLPRAAFSAPLPPPPPMLAPPGMPVMPPHMVTLPAPHVCCPCTAAPVCSHGTPASADVIGPMPTKANVGVETCMQVMGLASDLCSFARAPSIPSLCESALFLAMDLCPFAYAQSPTPCVIQAPPCAASCGHCVPPPPAIMGYRVNGNCGLCGSSIVAAGQPVVCMECGVASSIPPTKLHIIAAPSSDELEMNVGGTCIHCKKMTVTIGDNEIMLSRFDDRVRVRGEELKATAASVRSDCNDHLILEGDVVLHYKKDGHSANITGDCIGLDLCSGAVTIKPAAKTSSYPAVHIERIDSESK